MLAFPDGHDEILRKTSTDASLRLQQRTRDKKTGRKKKYVRYTLSMTFDWFDNDENSGGDTDQMQSDSEISRIHFLLHAHVPGTVIHFSLRYKNSIGLTLIQTKKNNKFQFQFL